MILGIFEGAGTYGMELRAVFPLYSSVHNSGRAAYFGRAIIALVWAIRAMMLLAATPAIIAGVALP